MLKITIAQVLSMEILSTHDTPTINTHSTALIVKNNFRDRVMKN